MSSQQRHDRTAGFRRSLLAPRLGEHGLAGWRADDEVPLEDAADLVTAFGGRTSSVLVHPR